MFEIWRQIFWYVTYQDEIISGKVDTAYYKLTSAYSETDLRHCRTVVLQHILNVLGQCGWATPPRTSSFQAIMQGRMSDAELLCALAQAHACLAGSHSSLHRRSTVTSLLYLCCLWPRSRERREFKASSWLF